MARNRFDVDESLETPFSIKHLLRAGVYIKRHAKKMVLSIIFSAISAACALIGPKLIEIALNDAVPNKDFPQLFFWPASCSSRSCFQFCFPSSARAT